VGVVAGVTFGADDILDGGLEGIGIDDELFTLAVKHERSDDSMVAVAGRLEGSIMGDMSGMRRESEQEKK